MGRGFRVLKGLTLTSKIVGVPFLFCNVFFTPVNSIDSITQRCVRYGTYRGVLAVYTAGVFPVPDTSVSLVLPYRYREYRYRTEHTLGITSLNGIVHRFIFSFSYFLKTSFNPL